MAEAAVNFAIETLGSLLVDEIKLLGGVKKEVESIKSEMESLRSFLKDADARAALEELGGGTTEEGVRTWVKQLREEAYRMEDVIDEYTLMVSKLPRGSGLFGILRRIGRFIKKLWLHHAVATEIQDIKSSLGDIKQRARDYNFRSVYQGSSSTGTRIVIPHDSRVGSFFLEDDEVVGIESTKDKLVNLLVNGRYQRSVIAVVGEGGLGKSTLAGRIYENQDVKDHFHFRAWVTVGKDYIKKDLLRMIIQEFYSVAKQSAPAEIYNMEERDLIFMLREQLKDKRYMVVFDDVWKVDFWGDVEHALLDNKNHSRIFVTTRHMKVAEFCKSSSFVEIHELETLPPNEAWKLFCRKAFGPSSESCCPSELKDLSHDILSKCRGLPLAIVAVGGLLSTKNKDVSEWQKLLDGLGSKLGSDPYLKDCNRVLSEGYHDLSHHLKSCLLYFGIFPKSREIKCSRLMRLWIAEGFIQYSRHPTSEQIAQDYLNELIDRSLVLVSKRYFSGQAKTCRVHDLMYEIIMRKTKEMSFCQFLNQGDLSYDGRTRRISIYKSTDGVVESIKDSKVRSIFLFNVDNLPDPFMHTIVADFKLMKILDLERAPIHFLPDGVGNLFHLHYLSIRYTKVEQIPKSIGKLLNLETLDLRNSLVSELPVEIGNLKKLRYLHTYSMIGTTTESSKIPVGFGSLTNLQKLSFVKANSQVVKELKKLKQLKKLGVCLTEDIGTDLCVLISDLENLETLTITRPTREDILDIEFVVSPPQNLQRLAFTGNMRKLPDWIFKLKCLIRIHLWLPRLMDDPLRILQALPNLRDLRFFETYDNESLHFKKGWFPQLLELVLSDYKAVKYVIIENGAMPNLRDLTFQKCPLLMEIPAGIKHLRNLKSLLFFSMLRQVYYMTRDDENWKMITQHIPEIYVVFMKAGKYNTRTTKYLLSLPPSEIEQLIEESDKIEE